MAEQEWSGMAIAGFVLSFLWFLSILGLIFSIIGMKQTKDNKKKGRGLAIAGLVISIVVSFFVVMVVLSWVLVGIAS